MGGGGWRCERRGNPSNYSAMKILNETETPIFDLLCFFFVFVFFFFVFFSNGNH